MSLAIKDKARIRNEYGADLQELTPELAEYLALAPKRGVVISGIRNGSRADKDGLKAGDIITKVDDKKTTYIIYENVKNVGSLNKCILDKKIDINEIILI